MAAVLNKLGIKPNYNNPDGISRGESTFSSSTAGTYVEDEPTITQWVKHVTPGPRGIARWAYHLFPFTHWITRYNVQWLFGDLVAGDFLSCTPPCRNVCAEFEP